MKLTLAQALVTVLNIKQDGDKYFICNNGIDIPLSKNLFSAITQAVEHFDLEKECHYAIFPMESERKDLYIELERELLRQEAMPHMEEHKAWESFGTDPRNAIMCVMDITREAATNLIVPPVYRQVLVKLCCVAIASLQWCDKWIEKLTVLAKDPELQKRIISVDDKIAREIEQATDTEGNT